MAMRRPGGALICVSPAGEAHSDSFTCGHCNGVVLVGGKDRAEDIGGLCKLCMRFTCAACTARGICDPFEKKLERDEASYHARRYMAEAR
jgi:hypothetical protein